MLKTDDIKKLAKLSNLKLTDEEIETFAPQLDEIIQYLNKLDEVDTTKIEPLCYPNEETSNKFQTKEISSDTLSRDKVLKNANESQDGYIQTEAVLNND